MSKGQSLRALVTERLTAAAEEIFALVERTIAEYEEELCRSKEENQRKQQLLDQVLSPELLLHRTDVQIHWSPEPSLKQEIPETPQIKEEPEEQSIKQEEVQLPQFTAVCEKSEEQRQTEHREETQEEERGASETEEQRDNSSDTDNDEAWEPPASTSTAQMETEAGGDHYNQVQRKHTSPAAHNSALFTKYKSAPQTSATVRDGTGAEGGEHECSSCEKRFVTKNALLRHTRVHRRAKPYSCLVCEKTFAYEGNFYVHMRLHTGETPYGCSICKKAFTVCSELNKHMETHIGVKRYSCLICQKAFSRRDYCDLHMRVHRGESPFRCSICEKTFISEHALHNHTRTHPGSGGTLQVREKRVL